MAVDLVLGDAVVDLVAEDFDMALRIAALPASSMRARRLCAVARLLVTSPTYLAEHGHSLHPRDLVDHACLGYAYLPTPDRWRFAGPDGAEVAIKPKGPLRANNVEALAPALHIDLGIAVQPEFLVWEELATGRLARVLPECSPPPIALHAITPPSRHRVRLSRRCSLSLNGRLRRRPGRLQVDGGSMRLSCH